MPLCCFSLTWGCSSRWVELPAVGRSGAGTSGRHGCWGSPADLPLLLQLHWSPQWQRHLWHSSWAWGSGLSMPHPLLSSHHTAWMWNINRWTVSSTKKCRILQAETLSSRELDTSVFKAVSAIDWAHTSQCDTLFRKNAGDKHQIISGLWPTMFRLYFNILISLV